MKVAFNLSVKTLVTGKICVSWKISLSADPKRSPHNVSIMSHYDYDMAKFEKSLEYNELNSFVMVCDIELQRILKEIEKWGMGTKEILIVRRGLVRFYWIAKI